MLFPSVNDCLPDSLDGLTIAGLIKQTRALYLGRLVVVVIGASLAPKFINEGLADTLMRVFTLIVVRKKLLDSGAGDWLAHAD